MGRPHRRLVLVFASATLVGFLAVPAGAAAGQEPRLRADLDGRPIKPEEVSSYFCHDFAYPDIHCFSTPEALEASLSAGTTRLSDSAVTAAALTASDYVTLYSLPSYSGSFAHLSQNYDALASIGWNDTVSSYRARNGRSGVFYEHWFASGTATGFCCNQAVPTLSAAKDNTFSSVYQR